MTLAKCHSCGAPIVQRWDLFEVRREYRRSADRARVRTWTEYVICRDCAWEEFAWHDRKGAPAVEQGSLW